MLMEIEKVFNWLNYTNEPHTRQLSLTFFSDERADMRELINKLSWNKPQKEQKHSISALVSSLYPHEYIYLVLPDRYEINTTTGYKKYYKNITGKSMWENAAKALIQIGWPKVDNIIIPLFFWLLDPNWPGSELIRDFMLSIPQSVLSAKIESVIRNPQNYTEHDYIDLKTQLEDLLFEMKEQEGRGDGLREP